MAKKVIEAGARRERKRLCLLTAIALFAAYTLCCFAISPVYTSVISDISYSESLLPDILMLTGSLLEVFAISVAYAALIRGLFRFGVKGYLGGIGIFMGATLYKYFANTLISWYFAGSVPTTVGADMLNILFYVALEGIQLAVAVLIVNRAVGRDRKRAEYARAEGVELEVASERPIKKIFDGKHPMCRAALYCAIVVFLSKMLGEIFNDALTIIWFGLPQKAPTVFLMILNYLSTAVFGAVCYGAVIMTLSYLTQKRDKM